MDHEVIQHHATAQAIEANPWSEVCGEKMIVGGNNPK